MSPRLPSALEHFSPGNLTALRELALRRTAQTVDEQLLTHMRTHAIRGPWAAGDRVLICIDESPGSASLVRYARRMADRLRAPWTALNIETVRSLRFSEEERDRVAAALRLAEQLGGEAITIPGQNAPRKSADAGETMSRTSSSANDEIAFDRGVITAHPPQPDTISR
jgi:two-component system sensor histidine kinase KdpD